MAAVGWLATYTTPVGRQPARQPAQRQPEVVSTTNGAATKKMAKAKKRM
jgi:hypothetical protein